MKKFTLKLAFIIIWMIGLSVLLANIFQAVANGEAMFYGTSFLGIYESWGLIVGAWVLSVIVFHIMKLDEVIDFIKMFIIYTFIPLKDQDVERHQN